MNVYTKHIFICTNQKAPGKTCCANTGGQPFFHYLKQRLSALNLHGPGKIRVSQSGCLGRCELGPCLVVYPDGVWYTYSSEADIETIIQQVLIENKTVEHLLIPSR